MWISIFKLWIGILSLVTHVAWAGDSIYRVGPGDLVEIKVLGESEFSGPFRVGTDGSIDFPFLKKVPVQGLTTEEISDKLLKLLRDGYLINPQVAAEVKEYKSQTVLVLGAVARPGTYSLEDSSHILELISKAGGIAAFGGKQILVVRSNNRSGNAETEPTKPIVVDYYRLVHEGDFSQNIELKSGDIINVPKANEIFVLGNVARPGPIKFEEQMTILQAVVLAGGPTATASTKSTYVLRTAGGTAEKIEIRLDKILENKEKNVALKAGDVIVIPESFF